MTSPISLGVMADTGDVLSGVSASALENLTGKPAESAVPADTIQKKAASATESNLGVDDGINPEALDEAGWAILYGPGVSQQIKDALAPLIEHRKSQVNNDRIFKIFEGEICSSINRMTC